MKSNRWIIIAGIVFVLCIACGSILFIARIISPTGGTPTSTIVDASILIAQTAELASTQTAMAIIPTMMITSTNLPTLTQPAVTVPTAIETTPVTPISTLPIINIPTNTVVFVLPTKTIIFVLPTKRPPPAGGTCSCSSNTYNCSDFSSHASAQACFEYCIAQGAGDIHRLDGDNDGLACENN